MLNFILRKLNERSLRKQSLLNLEIILHKNLDKSYMILEKHKLDTIDKLKLDLLQIERKNLYHLLTVQNYVRK